MDIDSLSLEEKVGQLFIVNFEGTEKTGELIHLITYFKVGGLFYRAENVSDLKKLHKLSTTVQFFAKTGLPLFLATTQEGGDVNEIADGLTISLSQAKLGLANNRLYTRQMAEIVGQELRALGVNMNFAPVLNTKNGFDDERYFSKNIDLVAKHGVAAIQGYEKAQVCAVVKYFPNIYLDNIHNILSIPVDRKTSEIYPFYRAIKYGASGILVTNSIFKNSNSLSDTLLNELLRERVQFDGMIITEANETTDVQSIISFIQAGCDMIYLQTNYENQIRTISAVLEAVKTGIISEDRINQSVKRILAVKEKHQIGEIPPFKRERFRKKRSLDLVDRLIERATVSN